MGTFLRLLGECGYGWAYRVLDAQYIRVDRHERAVPQRRRRVILVAHLGDAAGPATVLFERESLRGDPAPRREAGEGVADPSAPGTDRCGFGGGNRSGAIDAAACLTARGHKCDFEVETFITETAGTLPAGGNATGGNRQPGTGAETTGTMLVAHAYRVTPNDGAYPSGEVAASLTTGTDNSSITLLEPVAHALRAEGFDAVAFAIQERAVSNNLSAGPQGKGYQPDVAYTLEARHHVQSVAFGWAVRRLTPRECERLMGVPDDFTAITYRGKPAADGPRYKALGNSQGANKMRWLARGLLDVIAAQARAA